VGAVQLKPIALDVVEVTVNPVGAAVSAAQDAAGVSVEACVEAADEPSVSTAFTV
jgi:hypothetical protein